MRLYAWLSQLRGNQEQASFIINEALVQQNEEQARLDMADKIENLAMAMNIGLVQGDMALAEQHGLLAIDLVETQYEQFESERLGPSWGSRTHRIYVQLAEAYIRQHLATGDQQALGKALQ